MRDDEVYLRHIAECIALVEQYVTLDDGTLSEALFTEDALTQDAVLRRLEILADAASHLSGELKARHPHIPWRQINDFRNVLAHAYMDIRVDRVWSVIEVDLPPLKAAVSHELTQ